MRNFLTTICLLALSLFGYSQMADDFTVTDYNNNVHTLYADYLDQDITVVIKIFFAACPPCQGQAPFYQEKYEDWGSGEYDVAFFEMSNKSWDSNQDVKNFSNTYGTSMPGVGEDGDALTALNQFTSGTFGNFYGTPTYLVIAPDGEVIWDTSLGGLDDAISSTGALGAPEPEPEPSVYSLKFKDLNNNPLSISNNVQIIMESESDASYSLDITPFVTAGNFEYPTENIPEIEKPTLTILNNSNVNTAVSSLDLILIQKHLLGITPFQNELKVIAADVNNSGSISAIDLIELQKYLLQIFTELPNKNLLNYYFPDCQNCTKLIMPLGLEADFEIDVIELFTGNVN